jgi:hypothetical protein
MVTRGTRYLGLLHSTANCGERQPRDWLETLGTGKRVADAGRAPKFVGISGGNQVLGDESFQKVFLNEEEQVSYLKDTPRAAFEASTQL